MRELPKLQFTSDERRSEKREALVLRVGVISSNESTSFCLVKNISPRGMLVKLFGRAADGACVFVRVGDEPGISGRVAWVNDQFAGIEFIDELRPETLLRVAQKLAPTKRRSSPRVSTAAKVIVRTAGTCSVGTVLDISAMGARVQLGRLIKVGPTAIITLPGFLALRAFARWQEDREVGLAFETPLPIALIASWIDEQVCVRP